MGLFIFMNYVVCFVLWVILCNVIIVGMFLVIEFNLFLERLLVVWFVMF